MRQSTYTIKKIKSQVIFFLTFIKICGRVVLKGEGMQELVISSKEYEIPELFLDIDYIPTELVSRGFFPPMVIIDGELWVANVQDAYPFYERYKIDD